MSTTMSGTNLYEAARLAGGSSIIENLQSQLKLREGEITQLQVAKPLNGSLNDRRLAKSTLQNKKYFNVVKQNISTAFNRKTGYDQSSLFLFLQLEISGLERSRSVMAEELVRLTNQNDDMEEMVNDIPKLKVQLKV